MREISTKLKRNAYTATFHNTFPGQSITYLNASSNSATLHNAIRLITVTSYGTHMYDT